MPALHQAVPHLRRRRLGVIHLTFFTIAAAAPLAVVAGVVTTTFAVTGNTGVPLSYILIACALALFAVGYAAMSRHVANAGAFYSYLANGLGRNLGRRRAAVALISYNALQIGIYGLFGATFGDFAATPGINLPWFVWAYGAMLAVGTPRRSARRPQRFGPGGLPDPRDSRVMIYNIGALTHPAGGVVSRPASPPRNSSGQASERSSLGSRGFIGFESGAIYSEECRNPRVTVARATFVSVA